ncbi:unnamed protein product [Dibothriocephalus latus]|uniref:Uncharacterized protein n=1 Tax=Dibothriocephalus latus TaxID=60516 RepID=A0A3P6QG69_DIBLA|nr:unnamed protein product [Dibothriocephalus latus]
MMGAVFGAPIEFRDQSLRQPIIPFRRPGQDASGHLKDPDDLADLILRYVELLPRRLNEGIDVWRSSLLPLAKNGCIPDTTVNLDLKYREDATCLRFTAFRHSGNLVTVQGLIGDNFSALDHFFLHLHRVWEANASQSSPEEVVRLFSLLSRTVCGQTEEENTL